MERGNYSQFSLHQTKYTTSFVPTDHIVATTVASRILPLPMITWYKVLNLHYTTPRRPQQTSLITCGHVIMCRRPQHFCWYSQYVKLLGSFDGNYLKFAMCNRAYSDVLIVWNRARHCGKGSGINTSLIPPLVTNLTSKWNHANNFK